MNRNKKIIICITGIVIVILALLGLTYAYFVTNIKGNTNDKSIEVTTANLLLKYEDGNGTITATNIMPGTELPAKNFTVTNEGNATISSYAVYLENVINTMVNTRDVVYTLTCTSSVVGKTCNGVGLDETDNPKFPTYNDIIITNSIDVDETQTYSLIVTYLETNQNQSDDMGKSFSGKVQIYDTKSIVDITGVVTGSNEGDYVELQSTPKVSQINVDKEYKITAVEPGTHTLYLKDKNNNVLASKQIIINRSSVENIDGTTINVTNDSGTINTDLTYENNELIIDIKNIEKFNPWSEGTLAYAILSNAQEKKNGTEFREKPLTTPGKEVSKFKYVKQDTPTTFTSTTTAMPENYYTYADDYIIDEVTGKYTLINPQVGKYSDIYTSLAGKYIVSTTGSTENKIATYKDISIVYMVSNIDAEVTSTTFKNTSLIRAVIAKKTETLEKNLSITSDDHGNSYYFRGGVKDNYINYSGMCWRIVRIEGDGSVKLVLADESSVCNNDTINKTDSASIYKGNYGYIHNEDKTDYADYSNSENRTTSMKYIFDKFLNGGTVTDEYYELEDKTFPGINNQSNLKIDDYCLGDKTNGYDKTTGKLLTDAEKNSILLEQHTSYYYETGKRLKLDKTASLKCDGEIVKEKIGPLTADEVTFAGNMLGNSYGDRSYYLNDNIITSWFTISYFSQRYIGAGYCESISDIITPESKNSFKSSPVSSNYSLRPSITLISGVQLITGDGTVSNPYTISE